MTGSVKQHRIILQDIARRVMLERGLLPDFSAEALAELSNIEADSALDEETVRDLRHLPWVSIDNDDSLDLDQLTVAEVLGEDTVKIMVAVADVDALVRNGTAIDDHACHNTTSIYTAAVTFPMLPEKLSTNLTSLNLNKDRPAIVIDMIVSADGSVKDSDIYRAHVRNHAKLAYNSIAAWLEGKDMPEALAVISGLSENLRIQDRLAQRMKAFRHDHGALDFETIEARPVFEGDKIRELNVEKRNRAKDLIEDFMIAANGATSRYLSSQNVPSLRRVVRTPKRWSRIVELASEHGFNLSDTPDPKGLENFLMKEKATDPLRFPDLSLAIIKLLGPGEYVAEIPGNTHAVGHFGLAVRDYTHSTAPNRRYPDLITQRMLKSALNGQPPPYAIGNLETLAEHCTEMEDVAKKVERQVEKSAAAMLLESRIGDQFDAIVTGAAPKGTWVRLLDFPVEGRLIQGFKGVDVGHRVRVQLIHTDVDRGFIDFKRIPD